MCYSTVTTVPGVVSRSVTSIFLTVQHGVATWWFSWAIVGAQCLARSPPLYRIVGLEKYTPDNIQRLNVRETSTSQGHKRS